MTFDQWRNRPVYKAQCHTFKLAQAALGMPRLESWQGVATRSGHVLTTFRAFPQYRTPEARALRQQVAAMVRQERTGLRITCSQCSALAVPGMGMCRACYRETCNAADTMRWRGVR